MGDYISEWPWWTRKYSDDDMIVSGGENVFPQEVEELLIRHPAITDVAVVGVDDEKFGKRLAAFVVTAEGADLTADEAKAFVKQRTRSYRSPREGSTRFRRAVAGLVQGALRHARPLLQAGHQHLREHRADDS